MDVLPPWTDEEATSIEPRHHLVLGERLEILNVKTLGCKDWSHVGRDELVVQVRRNRQFYITD